MNSIDQQQPEQNRAHLSGAEAVAKMRELVKKAPTCMFGTSITTGSPISMRPMSVQRVDDDGSLWFLSANDSHKDTEILQDGRVQLVFAGSAHTDFMTLYGRAELSADRKIIEELWSPLLKTWFTEGKDDPRISVIQVIPESGYYWDTKHSRPIVFAKMVVGAVLGKTLDDSIQGQLRIH